MTVNPFVLDTIHHFHTTCTISSNLDYSSTAKLQTWREIWKQVSVKCIPCTRQAGRQTQTEMIVTILLQKANSSKKLEGLRGIFDAELCEVFSRWKQVVPYYRQIGFQMTDNCIDVAALITNRFDVLPRQLHENQAHCTTINQNTSISGYAVYYKHFSVLIQLQHDSFTGIHRAAVCIFWKEQLRGL